MENVTINGVTYEVMISKTPEQTAADGHVNTARMMRENGQARQVYLKRPRGKRQYFAVEYTRNGRNWFGDAVSLRGNW